MFSMQKAGTMAGIGVLSLAVLCVLPQPAAAKKSYLLQIKNSYHLDDKANCNYCHTLKGNERAGKGNLNAYGKAVRGKLDGGIQKALEAVESLDSDGDGATNGEELKLGNLPGDASDKPDEKKLAELRKANPSKK